MEELTNKQEDLILEREKQDELILEMGCETQTELFNDFISDNIFELKQGFIEQYNEEWVNYCKEGFEVWFEDYKYMEEEK